MQLGTAIGFFIKHREVNLYGNKAYAYIVLDLERKARQIRKLFLNALEEEQEVIFFYFLLV